MKESAGEANLTVIAIILIAVVVAIATPIVSSLMGTATYKSCCTGSGLIWKNGVCTTDPDTSCDYYGEREGAYRNFDEYISCVKNSGGNTDKANGQYYRFGGCKN